MFKKVLFTILVAMFLCTGLAVAQPTDPVVEETVVEEAEPLAVDLSKPLPLEEDIDITLSAVKRVAKDLKL